MATLLNSMMSPEGEESRIDEEAEVIAIPSNVLDLVSQRTAAKQAKDWELAEELRTRIKELGFVVKDVEDGEPIATPS